MHLFFLVNLPKGSMTTYISILRGINVSGQKLIKMDALRKSYENLGFRNVTTYVQSGNVLFKGKNTKPAVLAQVISRQIDQDFGFDVPVIVLSIDKLKQIMDRNPFAKEKESAFLYVTFLASQPAPYDKKIIEDKKLIQEEIGFTDEAIYLYCPKGYGTSKLNNNLIENKLKVIATTRNWKTTNELLKIAQQIT